MANRNAPASIIAPKEEEKGSEAKGTAGVKRTRDVQDGVDEDHRDVKCPTLTSSADISFMGDEEDDSAHTQLETKRAYNRLNAARARQRVKDQLSDLSKKVENFSQLNEKLQHSNEELQCQVLTLAEENSNLKLFIASSNAGVPGNAGVQGLANTTQQGGQAQNPLLLQVQADVPNIQQGWRGSAALSLSIQEHQDSTAPFVQSEVTQSADANLALQLLLARREVERQHAISFAGPQDLSATALTALGSQALMARQNQVHQQLALNLSTPNQSSLQQRESEELERQRAMLLALLSQTQNRGSDGR
jgi:hypothetical protein